MERILQYLDDLEDTVYAVALIGERLRRVLRLLVGGCLALATLALGFVLALTQLPLALALVSLLTVTALYRAAVSNVRGSARGPTAGA